MTTIHNLEAESIANDRLRSQVLLVMRALKPAAITIMLGTAGAFLLAALLNPKQPLLFALAISALSRAWAWRRLHFAVQGGMQLIWTPAIFGGCIALLIAFSMMAFWTPGASMLLCGLTLLLDGIISGMAIWDMAWGLYEPISKPGLQMPEPPAK